MAISRRLSPVIIIGAILGCALGCAADAGFRPARATWFDVGDMSRANCHFSWAPTGRDVGALSDVQDGFSSSCGRCYEVKCRNADVVDGYGKVVKRSDACYDENKSVIITIVDACPCRYPNNAYSNQRWCCGDMDHLDLSQEAFQKLADLNKGVIGLSYREVDCSASASAGGGSSGGGSSGGGSNGSTGDSGGSAGDGYSTGTGSSLSDFKPQMPSWGGWWSGF